MLELDSAWGYRASRCQRENRDLTAAESDALDAATVLLETVLACRDGTGQWRDLDGIETKLNADFKAIKKRRNSTTQGTQK